MNNLDYLKLLENIKENSSVSHEEITYTPQSIPQFHTNLENNDKSNITTNLLQNNNLQNDNIDNYVKNNIENNSIRNDLVVEEENKDSNFEKIFNSFYTSEFNRFIASLSSKNIDKFRLSEVSDCLMKIFYSKHVDTILNKYGNLINADSIYYILNLHAIKGTSTHEYIQKWLQKTGITNCEVETKIEYTINGITLVGRTDILVYSNEPYIVEMKSSTKYSMYHELQLQLQMFVVNNTLQNKLPKKIEKSYLWYYFTRKYYPVNYDEQYVLNFLQYLRLLKSLLSIDMPLELIFKNYNQQLLNLTTKDKESCNSCIYRNICLNFLDIS